MSPSGDKSLRDREALGSLVGPQKSFWETGVLISMKEAGESSNSLSDCPERPSDCPIKPSLGLLRQGRRESLRGHFGNPSETCTGAPLVGQKSQVLG